MGKKQMNILAVILSILMIGMVFSGCKNSTSSSSSSNNSKSTSSNDNSTVKIVWYGCAPHPFFDSVKIGVEAFAKDYNIKVNEQIGTDWTQVTETNNIEALAAQGYKNFAVYPADPSGANGLYDELTKQGCQIVNFAAQTVSPTKASFCVTTDIAESATLATEKLISLMGEKGSIVNVLEMLTDSNTIIRKNAIEAVVKKYPNVHIIQEISGMSTVAESVQKIGDSISANLNNVDGIIATGSTSSDGLAQTLENYKAAGNSRTIHAIGIDMDAPVVKAVKDGSMDGTILQNAYGMGYIPCLLLKDLQQGWKNKASTYTEVNTGCMFLDKSNIDNGKELQVQMTKTILDTLESKYLTK